jgi:hypothetical protein
MSLNLSVIGKEVSSSEARSWTSTEPGAKIRPAN